MSTLNVTTVKTANSSTDLVLTTGNTSGPEIILNANGNALVIQGNSTVNSISVNSTVATITGGMTVSAAANVTGNVVIGGTANVTGNVVLSGTANVTGNVVLSGTANVTGNVTSSGNINAAAANFSTNTLALGVPSIGTTAGSNGYSRLTNGLLIQWFTASVVNTGAQSFNFPIAFTTACFSLTGTYSSTTTGATGVKVSITNSTAFSANTIGNNSNGSFHFIALGI